MRTSLSKFFDPILHHTYSDVLFYIRNQSNFAEHMFASMRGLCRVGGLGPIELILLYAYRGSLGQIENGLWVISASSKEITYSSSVEAHSDDDIINFSTVEDFEPLQARFERWASTVIPERKLSKTHRDNCQLTLHSFI